MAIGMDSKLYYCEAGGRKFGMIFSELLILWHFVFLVHTLYSRFVQLTSAPRFMLDSGTTKNS